MSREDVATALDKAAEALAEAAHALRGIDAPAAGRPLPAPVSEGGASREASPPPATQEPSHDICPKHNVAFENGTYGPYCKQMTDDPAWGKAKVDRDGNPVLWCKITPKNAPQWLRINAA